MKITIRLMKRMKLWIVQHLTCVDEQYLELSQAREELKERE